MADAEGGIFSQEAMDIYPSIPTSQKDLLASHMFKKLLQDEAIKKAQDEAVKKQQDLTKENLRRNQICLVKEKLKKSIHNQKYMENLL